MELFCQVMMGIKATHHTTGFRHSCRHYCVQFSTLSKALPNNKLTFSSENRGQNKRAGKRPPHTAKELADISSCYRFWHPDIFGESLECSVQQGQVLFRLKSPPEPFVDTNISTETNSEGNAPISQSYWQFSTSRSQNIYDPMLS